MKKGTIVYAWAIFSVLAWLDISIYLHLQGIPVSVGFVAILVCYGILRYYFYKKEDAEKQEEKIQGDSS